MTGYAGTSFDVSSKARGATEKEFAMVLLEVGRKAEPPVPVYTPTRASWDLATAR